MKFQRTRGVLRLMASVIHSLWEKDDRNPLILPANIAIDDPRVQFELTRYLSDNWVPVIEKDVDGPSSLPLRIDGAVPNLGKFHAFPTRRASDLSGIRTHCRCGASGSRGPSHQTWLCHAGGVSGGFRRCAAAAGRFGDVPLPGWASLLVLHTANCHEAGGGSRRAVEAQPRQGCAGTRFATPLGSPQHG